MDRDELERVLRAEAPHVVGALARRFGRFDTAEDAAQEALMAASEQWSSSGVPASPRSWLIRVGYRRMVDMIRSEVAARRREEEDVARDSRTVADDAGAVVGDDSLHLLLLCCHPVLSPASQVALTLRAVGGLTTAEIARAYGVTEQTMGVRISRAKQQLRRAGARFEFAAGEDLDARVSSVLRVLYLAFNEGYHASAGDRLVRADLAAEAIRLARMLHEQLPRDPEVAALVALMLLVHARRDARTDADGELVLLADQDRTRWDEAMLAEGTALIERVWTQGPVGPYQLQAAIAAVHASAPSAAATDWRQIAALYLALEHLEPAGPTMLARVVAVAHAYGDRRGLELLEELDAQHGLLRHPLTAQRAHAVRAHLLDGVGRPAAARRDYLAAERLAANDVEARYLRRRAGQPKPGPE
ncbi:RNA polymerase sigma factor [Nocardioides sp. R1-1]|uniref:RNA polymerase sigma factor n=1 Tax=Nocardioides sp. R1-1 TaxID=3383502 RepID=UPI0038CFEB78